MEQFLITYEQSLRHLRVAEHILTVTHPLLQDPKLLLGVIDNLFLALKNALKALLLYDYAHKNIPPFVDDLDGQLRMFQVKSMPLHDMDEAYLSHFYDMRELIRRHRTSTVEFRRKDRFVMCTPSYDLTVVTVSTMRTYLIKTKQFVGAVGTILNNERLSRGSQGRIEAC